MGALTGHPWPLGHDAVSAYPRGRGQSSRGPRVPHHSPRPPHPRPSRPPPRSVPGACPGFDAARLRPSPGSVSSTTPVSSEDRSAVPLLASSTPSRGHSSSTKPNERTSSTSPAPPTASPPRAAPVVEPRASPRHDPASTGRWKRSRTASPSSRPSPEPARHQHPRPSVLLTGGRRGWPAAQPGQAPVPRPRLPRLLPDWKLSPRCAWA